MSGYSFLADLIVVVHFCYVAFTVGGELVILLGGACRWQWVRNLRFRIVHIHLQPNRPVFDART